MKHPFADAVRVLDRYLPPAHRPVEPWILTNRDEVARMTQANLR